MNKDWSELNKIMQQQLKKKDTFAQGIETLLRLRGELMMQILQLREQLPADALRAMPFPNAKGYHSKSIAYSLWHIFRIEDIVAHTLIAEDEQVFFRGDYQRRIQAPIITTGNELGKEEIDGIGADFFRYMTPEHALHSYEGTLETARRKGDTEIEKDLLYRAELMKRFPKYCFDMDELTCSATHGDFFISQMLCGENKINAVIDWTTACVHPVVWEIMRSYVYAAPECADGEIDTEKLIAYFNSYCEYARLNGYDIENAAKLFYYQIAVCDYYGQYYTSDADNREIYLRQAVFSTKLLQWFEKHIEELTKALREGVR